MGNCVAAEAGAVVTPVNKPTRTVFGDRKAVFFDVTMSSAYASGGDNLDLSPWFKNAVDFVDIEGVTVAGTSYRPEYVRGTTTANGKLKVYSGVGSGNAEASGDLHTVTFRVMGVGK
jgi:hypothetical protein